jgi:polyphosphate kinase 2
MEDKRAKHGTSSPLDVPPLEKKDYQEQLRSLQIELVKFQRHFIDKDEKILILLEGRDTAGKDGLIKRVIAHLSPRETRVVALGKPSERDRSCWYFQRYVSHLPAAQEMVLFNRSWYNRAGVERVMGFCTDHEYHEFMDTVLPFEEMLIRSGIRLYKYYLDIHKKEQIRRMEMRYKDPLKHWKVSPIDQKATELWKDYSHARNEMLAQTHNTIAPWTVVRADNKRHARLQLIRHFLSHQDYRGKDESVLTPNPDLVFTYHEAYLKNGMIAP